MTVQISTLGIQTRERVNRIALQSGGEIIVRSFRFDERDYRHAVAIENAIDPENPSSVESWRHWDRNRDNKYLFRRFVVKKDRRVVATAGYGHTPWIYEPDKYYVHVAVDPEQQGQGIGTALYDFLIGELAAREPATLVSWTREDRKIAVRFLEKRGFKIVLRAPVSRLDPAKFDASRFDEKIARTEGSGIVIKTMKELSSEDPDWKRKMYDLEWECLQDVPHNGEWTKRPFEQFERQTLSSPTLLPEAWFVALDGDQYVGLSVLWRNLATDRLLETGLTGVVRSHRRRGVATALKVRAIQYAQERGNPQIETDNEENNPMFLLNLQLGFKPTPAFLDFENQLKETTE